MPYEIDFLDMDIDKDADRAKLKAICEKDGWRPLWFDRVITNDGVHDYSKHIVVIERGRE